MRKSFRVLLITLHALKKGDQFVKRTLCLILTFLTFVTLAFAPNAFAQDTPLDYVVRTIYFVPKDRESNPDMDRKLDSLMKRAKQFYADLMEYHEFGEKTFRLETDATGNTIVHHVTGKFNNAYYQNREERNGSLIVWDEIEEQFDTSKNIYVLVLDTSDGIVIGDLSPAGLGGGDSHSGNVLLPAHNYNAALHELGHAFGLAHDSRAVADRWTESGLTDTMITSFCAAEWLDANRYFNSTQAGFDDAEPSVEMLTPSLVSAPITIRLQFEVADPDGLHQAQLFGEAGIIACKKLEGQTTTFEFITADLRDNSRIVRLRLIDVHGNFTWHRLSIDLSDLLQPTATVSIPDSNLEAAVRERLGLASDATITQLVMLRLTLLSASNQQITDLTGLEYALNLQLLNLTDNQIEDITPLTNLTDLTRITLSGNPVTDITALAKLVNLTHLNCHKCNISDITPLAGLTNLKDLRLSGNPISDITPLKGLTNLFRLTLGYTERLISDIAPLEGLVNLRELTITRASISDIQLISKFTHLSYLSLYDLPISDISPLTGLTGLESLLLRDCEISDVSPLSGLTNLKMLALNNNQISDVSPLSELVNLSILRLQNNPIENTQPLIALLQKNPDVKIYLEDGAGPLVPPPVTLTLEGVGSLTQTTTTTDTEDVTFTLRVTNTSDRLDQVNLTVSGDVDTASLSTTSVELDADAHDDVTLTIPRAALSDARTYSVTITASNGDLERSITVTINVTSSENDYPLFGRTQQVQDAIVAAVDSVDSAEDITEDHLLTISTLHIKSKGITTLKTGDFAGLTSLTELSLEGNSLETLPADIFYNLSSLKHLFLASNNLTTLPSEVFNGSDKLQSIYMNNN